MDDTISEKTLRMIDKAAINLKEGKAGKPINLEEMKKIVDSLPDDE